MCMVSGETVDHLYLHCPMTLAFWHRLFSLVRLNWVPSRSISDTMTISFRGLVSTGRDKTLCLILIWIILWERNARIFEDKWRSMKLI